MSKSIGLMLVLIFLTALCIITGKPVFMTGIQLVGAQTEIATSAFISVEPNPAEANQDPVRVTVQIKPAPPTPADSFHVVVAFTRPDGYIIENYYDTNSDGANDFKIYLGMVGNWTLKLTFPGQTFAGTYYLPSESQITFTRLPPPPPPWSAIGNWTRKAPMQVARGGLGVAVVCGKIYAIGGSTASGWSPGSATGGYVGTNEEYDPSTDTWTYRESMPTPREQFGIAVYKNKIYCIGGKNNGALEVNEVYDPATDTWETKEPMPKARWALKANVVNSKIYLIGGTSGSALNETEIYDPENDSWTTKAPMPSGAFSYASTVVDNKIYVVGGYSDPPTFWSNLNRIYDPITGKWSYGSPAPSGVWAGAAGATTGAFASKRIYVLGVSVAVTPSAPLYSNQVYDPVADTWAACADLPTSREYFDVAVINDILYAIGGRTHNEIGYISPSALNEMYTPIGYGTVPPAVTVISPQNKTYNTSDIPLTLVVNKPTSQLEYNLDGLQAVAILGNTTLNGLSNGAHNITVYATDIAGNTAASETITFTINKEAETPQPPSEEPFPTAYSMGFVALIIVILLGSIVYILKRKR
jgi:N-acetylneuraminic acid mutarotase